MKLVDCCKINVDSYSSKDNWPVIRYLDTGNLTEGKIDEIQTFIPGKDKIPSRAKRKVKTGDILFSTVRPNQKHYGIVGADTENLLVSTGFAVITTDDNIADFRFIYYFLTQDYIVEALHVIAEQSVSAYPSIKPSDIERIDIPLPKLETQRKIAAILSALDDKIELNRRINANLEEQAAAIFKAWFVDYKPWNGYRPTNWEQVPLGTLVEIKRGGSPRPIQDYLAENGLRWLKISDVTSLTSPFVLEIKERIKEEGLRKTVFLKAGELVLSNSATPGIPKILDVDTCIHDGWLYFKNSRLPKYYLYLFFKHIRQELVALGNGSVFTNLKTDILKSYPIVQADDETLERFNALTEPLFQKMLNADRECADLIAVRDALLPRLMSGEIDVSDVSL